MSSFRDVRGFQCIRSMAAEGETLFFLRVRVEVGEGENIGLQCSQHTKSTLGNQEGQTLLSLWTAKYRLLLP